MTQKRPSLCSKCHSLRNHFIFALLFLRGCVGGACVGGGCHSGGSCDWFFPLGFDQDSSALTGCLLRRETRTPPFVTKIVSKMTLPPKIRPHPPTGDGVEIALLERGV